MTDSILNSIKADLGLMADYDVFDPSIIRHINSAFGTLNQLGLGPPQGFRIQSDADDWESFLNGDQHLEDVKSFVFLKVKMLFDPPPTSFAISAVQDQIKELEWRLNVKREDEEWTEPIPQ